MSPDEKLAAILAAVQTDPGNRGLARDPHDNLFTACPGDFVAACRSIAEHEAAAVEVVTGFFIPTVRPPAYETDGPLGVVFLIRALRPLVHHVGGLAESGYRQALRSGLVSSGMTSEDLLCRTVCDPRTWWPGGTHLISIERVGRAGNGRRYSMRGVEVVHAQESDAGFSDLGGLTCTTIGIGDGGNEIGMGKIPHETIVKNIPNGDLIHCRVPTDHLIVAGVSNWGAYALAAGVYVLRGVTPPPELFDADREREILEVMVREGPLVDGVTGKQTATVDGLSWDDYIRPFLRIREILES
ncbi:MAG: hypothetical protein JWO38_2263 [Gemmataceae bacterium]|nr:hypothetical protein [Gemmataceae bacterium]